MEDAESRLGPTLLSAAPLDFVFICNEHIPVDRAETSMLCQHWSLKARREIFCGHPAPVALPETNGTSLCITPTGVAAKRG